MDMLSDALGLIKAKTYISAGLDAGKKWAIQFPGFEGIKFNSVLKGSCFLKVDGDRRIHRLKAGDCFLLTSGRPFVLASDLKLQRIPSDSIYSKVKNDIATCNNGGDFFLVGARFGFSTSESVFLFQRLPPVIVLPKESAEAKVLGNHLQHFTHEFRSQKPGNKIILEHLMHLMLIQSLRVYMTSLSREGNWLAGLSDRKVAAAMTLVHENLKKNWKLEELALSIGLSRSVFAQRFKKVVGMSPVQYSINWKMLVAQSRLRETNDSIATIADHLGYESESSFRLAFKRVVDIPPGRFRN